MKNKRYKLLGGAISINSRGVGFFERPDLKEDILIEPENLGVALDGDEVDIQTHGTEFGIRGTVLKVIKRARTRFVGVVERQTTGVTVHPDNYRIHVDFRLAKNQAKLAKTGYKVYVELSRWDSPRQAPEAKLLKIIGRAGDHETEMQAIALAEDFAVDFPADVINETAAIRKCSIPIPINEIKRRRDFRDINVFTIDPADAKDFDDALSIKFLGSDEYEVGVHIADVSHFVSESTALNREAAKRATSVYLVDRTIPMLPPALSDDLCSLKEGEDKLTFSAVFTIRGEGGREPRFKITSRWFGKTIIRSRKRLAYEEAQKILNHGSGLFHKELAALNDIAKFLRREKFKNGAIDFEQDEVRFELDKNGRPLRVFRKERLLTHKLVEELMLLANREVAECIYRKEKETGTKRPFIYRVHDLPNREKIAELSIFLNALGHELPVTKGKGVSSKDLNSLFQKIEGKAEEALIKTAALRTMTKAIYSTRNIGHFGLAFPFYTHFTSPIRRYPDLLVHRILDKYLGGKKISTDEFQKLESEAIYSSRREIEAQEAERNSIKLKQVEYMASRIGKEFDGLITGVTEWGVYVEEKETKSEGMIKLQNLTSDYYILDKKNYCLTGRRSGKKYRLGDSINIKVTSADTKRRLIEYSPAS